MRAWRLPLMTPRAGSIGIRSPRPPEAPVTTEPAAPATPGSAPDTGVPGGAPPASQPALLAPPGPMPPASRSAPVVIPNNMVLDQVIQAGDHVLFVGDQMTQQGYYT